MIDKHGMMVKLLPMWLQGREMNPTGLARALNLPPDAANDIDPLTLLGRVAARELNTLCTAFMSENTIIEREQMSAAEHLEARAKHSRHIGHEPAA